MKLSIIRASESDDAPQIGLMLIDGTPFYLTLELPWKDNERQVSCIPLGEYTCKRTHSPKFGETFEVMNVPNRTGILFHAGNEAKDTHGCILLGNRLIEPDFISGSKVAFGSFMEKMMGLREFNLEIKKCGKKC